MATTTKAMNMLEDWLRTEKLPDIAKTCIENFVCSCNRLSEDAIRNFVYIDIINFIPSLQDKLIEGLVYSYLGLKPATYIPENMPDTYRVNLN